MRIRQVVIGASLWVLAVAGYVIAQQPVNLNTKLDQINDSITVYGSDDGGTTKRLIKTDSGGAVQIDLEVGHGLATAAGQDGIIKDGTGDTTQANVTSGRLNVDGSGVTQPVSGTVTIGTFPDNEPFNLNQVGGTAVTTDTTQPINAKASVPVRQPVSCTSRIAISQTADTQVITGVSGQRIFICAIMLMAAAAETVNIIEGTGSVCATSPTALYGSTTEANGMAFAANGGFSQTSGQPFVHTAVDANNLCITQVSTARISGSISYVVAAD